MEMDVADGDDDTHEKQVTWKRWWCFCAVAPDRVFYVFLWALWTAAWIGIMVNVGVGDFVLYFSRWMYVYVWICYTNWLFQYVSYSKRRGFWARYAYFFFFFYNGSIWFWTVLTALLVAVGPGIVLDNPDLLKRSDIGVITIALAFTHFSPSLFMVLYIYVHREELAIFFAGLLEETRVRLGSGLGVCANLINLFVAPFFPVFVYLIFFDPFEVYGVEQVDWTIWLASGAGAGSVFIVNGVALFYLYTYKERNYSMIAHKLG